MYHPRTLCSISRRQIEPDVTTRIASFTAMRDDAGTRTRTFAIRLADHFKAHILNIPVGGTHQFANAAARQAFAEMAHERIVQTCTAIFDWTDPTNTRRSWQCPAVDVTGILLAANQSMLTDMIQQSLTSVEDYVFCLLRSAIQPADCKITMHQFRTAVHANLANINARGSASLYYMDKTCNPHRRYEGLRRLLHKANLPVTGDRRQSRGSWDLGNRR
jgi:hypothetical protein